MTLFCHLSYVKKVVKYLYFVLVYILMDKKLLERFDFSQKSAKHLLSPNSGDVAGIFFK